MSDDLKTAQDVAKAALFDAITTATKGQTNAGALRDLAEAYAWCVAQGQSHGR